MREAQFDVVGIGNAIVDIIGRCNDDVLQTIGATKGSMRLVDANEVNKIYGAIGPAIEISGGSAANTIAGVASFGGRAAFIGTISDDDFGKVFSHDIRSIGVTFRAPPIGGGLPTSRSLILVTPDGERTMNTFLGISTRLGETQLDHALIGDAKILYLEGYLFDEAEAKKAFHAAVRTAKDNGRKVALSLSDQFCVDRHRQEFIQLIRSGTDILFGNESEIKSLYETSSFEDAAAKSSKDIPLAVLTRGQHGSLILEGKNAVEIASEPIKQLVDTTGAGDLYAAGFLFGYANGFELAKCGRFASLAASEIISHIGARPEMKLSDLARQRGLI